jgi:orotate phosphoribosyltransferase
MPTAHNMVMDALRATGALKQGHFVLSSGRHSDQYIEKFDLLRRPTEASAICAEIARGFAGHNVDVVVGPTTGGVLLAFEVARQLGVAAAYAERRSDGRPGREFRRGTAIPSGSRVLVVDDILTTGGSVRETLAALRPYEVEVVGIALLVDRSARRVDLDVPYTALATLNIASWDEAECPLCARGEPLFKPGTTPGA